MKVGILDYFKKLLLQLRKQPLIPIAISALLFLLLLSFLSRYVSDNRAKSYPSQISQRVTKLMSEIWQTSQNSRYIASPASRLELAYRAYFSYNTIKELIGPERLASTHGIDAGRYEKYLTESVESALYDAQRRKVKTVDVGGEGEM